MAAALSGILASSWVEGAQLNPETVLNREKMKPKGQWYEAQVPDTLDLAERAKYSVNVLTSNLDPVNHYALWNAFTYNVSPPKQSGPTWNLPCKSVRALPKLRVMSGSDQNLDVEYNLMRSLLSAVRQDGHLYYPFDGYGAPKDTSYPMTNGFMALACANWYARDGNPGWLDWVELLCRGLKNSAIRVGARAYYPPESGIRPNGEWLWTTRGPAVIPYTPPEEPVLEQQGLERTVKFEQSPAIRALVKCYQHRGDREALDLARQIVSFCLKPGMWEDTVSEGYPGLEHGIYAGHNHGNLTALQALLDFAIAHQNDALKQLVREAYGHAVRNGVIRIGWFPAWVKTRNSKIKRVAWIHNTTEACAVSDLLVLAVKLTDAGLGDYWDDVDAVIRNQLTAQQCIDLDLMRRISGHGSEDDALLERYIGGFGHSWPTAAKPEILGCCSANGAIGLYYAWHSITRFDRGVATVNLFLNRASSWMDVDSYLPYEGRVILHNKKARSAMVRIPSWLDTKDVMAYVSDQPVVPPHSGRYLIFDNLKEDDKIRLEFPLPERTDDFTIGVDLPPEQLVGQGPYLGKKYKVSFRGSTVIDIQPRDTNPKKYPIFQREHLKMKKTPMKKVKRFAVDQVLPLQ